MAVHKNDVDDNLDYVDFDFDPDCDGFEGADSSTEGVTTIPDDEVIREGGITPCREAASFYLITTHNNNMTGGDVLADSSAGGTFMTPPDEVIRANEGVSSCDDVSASPTNNIPINQGLEVPLVYRNILTNHPNGEVSEGATHPNNLVPARL